MTPVAKGVLGCHESFLGAQQSLKLVLLQWLFEKARLPQKMLIITAIISQSEYYMSPS